jgi:plastocyanin
MRRALIVVALVSVALATMAFSGNSSAQSTTIDAGDNYFCNPSFENGVCDTTVTHGSTVTWAMSGQAAHTVTQCDASFATCPPAGGFDSGFLSSGETFSFTFNSPGTIPYYCLFHPTQMRGRVIVQAQSTPTAAPTVPPGASTAAPQQTIVDDFGGATVTPGAVPAGGGGSGQRSFSAVWIALGASSVVTAVVVALLLRRRSG